MKTSTSLIDKDSDSLSQKYELESCLHHLIGPQCDSNVFHHLHGIGFILEELRILLHSHRIHIAYTSLCTILECQRIYILLFLTCLLLLNKNPILFISEISPQRCGIDDSRPILATLNGFISSLSGWVGTIDRISKRV